MVDNSRYFYIGGFFSLLLFSAFITLFFMMLFQSAKVKSYALHKNNFISISLANIQTDKAITHKPTAHPQKKVSKPVDIPSENIDVNNLFSDVWTKKITKKKPKPQDVKRLAQLRQQVPLSQVNEVPVKETKEETASSNAQEVNEYLAKIQAIVYEHFYVPQNSQGNSVKAVIELNSIGELIDFRILTYSANDALNEEADKIKQRLLHVLFPVNVHNKSTKTVVILRSKE